MKIIERHSNPYRLRYKYDEQLFCFVKIWNQNNFAHHKKLKNNFFFCLHVLSLKTKNFIKKKMYLTLINITIKIAYLRSDK